MFKSLGLFKKIPCPQQHECNLQNCIFDHVTIATESSSAPDQVYDPLSVRDVVSPPSKKRKLEISEEEESKPARQQTIVKAGESSLRRPPPKPTANHAGHDPSPSTKPVPAASKALVSASLQRPVSPPTKRAVSTKPVQKVEKLIPRPVGKAPASVGVRLSLVELTYKQISLLNSQASKLADHKDVILTDQQMITWVLDQEQEVATQLTNDIYRNAMSQKVLQLRKLKIQDWTAFVKEKILSEALTNGKDAEVKLALSPDEEIQVLKFVRTNLTGLDVHGYVTKAPTTAEVQQAAQALKSAYNWEVCDRCGARFQVFPGRDAQGRLTTKGECHYHWAKIGRGPWQKTDHITGQAVASFPCCGQPAGSEGCTKATTHVFKVTDPKRLALLWQFEQTPTHSDKRKRGPVAFDCEMAYTTQGLEMVRITAVSWPHNRELLDVLVRPFGEILDLNTRFSGVTPEQYANAEAYDASMMILDHTDTGDERPNKPLCRVDSPIMARHLMFDLLAPDTPLIGHAIDNDLNTCRMIHSFVVDTVLLFPHPRGLPIRYGLKVLATMYLNRSIQTGGDAGHDSKEDSITTGDLVRFKVAEKWKTMKVQQWKFQDGMLVPPSR